MAVIVGMSFIEEWPLRGSTVHADIHVHAIRHSPGMGALLSRN